MSIYLIKNTIYNICGLVPSVVYIYISWIMLHYTCARLYASFCTPYNIYGFLTSPFTVTLPHCQAFRWVIHTSGDNIMNMWVLLGAWCIIRIQLNKNT